MQEVNVSIPGQSNSGYIWTIALTNAKPSVPALSARTVRKNNPSAAGSQVNSGSSVIMNSVKLAPKPVDL